MSSVGQAKCK